MSNRFPLQVGRTSLTSVWTLLATLLSGCGGSAGAGGETNDSPAVVDPLLPHSTDATTYASVDMSVSVFKNNTLIFDVEISEPITALHFTLDGADVKKDDAATYQVEGNTVTLSAGGAGFISAGTHSVELPLQNMTETVQVTDLSAWYTADGATVAVADDRITFPESIAVPDYVTDGVTEGLLTASLEKQEETVTNASTDAESETEIVTDTESTATTVVTGQPESDSGANEPSSVQDPEPPAEAENETEIESLPSLGQRTYSEQVHQYVAQFFPEHDTGQPAVVEFVTLGCEDCLQWRDTGYASAAVTEHGAAHYVFEVDPSNNTTAMPQLREHYSDAAVVDLTPEQVEAVNLANLPTTFFMFNARDAMLLNHQAAYEVDSSQMWLEQLDGMKDSLTLADEHASDLLEVVTLVDENSPVLIQAGDTVRVDYNLYRNDDATLYQTSVGNQPFSFVVGGNQVITGFDQAVIGASEGDVLRATIESEWAYGASTGHELQTDQLTFYIQIQDVIPAVAASVDEWDV